MKTILLQYTVVQTVAKTICSLLWMIPILLLSQSEARAQEACGSEADALVLNQVWSAGPICVKTNIVVSNLTIMPGVTVLVTGDFSITVVGIIRAIGTDIAPVVFRPSTNNAGWKGFYFENTIPGSEFDHCRIEGADNSALQLIRSTPIIQNTVFTNCTGPYGGAIYANVPGRVLSVSNCVFESNQAVNDGGAIWCEAGTGRLAIVSCTFDRNVANPSYQTRNTGAGAIWLDGNGLIRQSRFWTNYCRAYTIYAPYGVYARGGAVYVAGGTCELAGSEFLGNGCHMTAHSQTPDWSYPQGGALYLYSGNVDIHNSLFALNGLSAQRNQQLRASAVYLRQGNVGITNSTFVGNQAAPTTYNEAGTMTIDSSIVYLNFDHITQLAGATAVSYSDVQGGYAGTGNIDYNPIFDAEYRILPGSPAIDTGNPSPALNDVSFPPLAWNRAQ